jgi:hypothetical protein
MNTSARILLLQAEISALAADPFMPAAPDLFIQATYLLTRLEKLERRLDTERAFLCTLPHAHAAGRALSHAPCPPPRFACAPQPISPAVASALLVFGD